GPVVLQAVSVASDDVIGLDSTHDQVHAREVEGVVFEFLGVVLNRIWITQMTCNSLADIEQQRSRTRGRVVDSNRVATLDVCCDDAAHNLGDLMRGIEITGLFAGVRYKVRDQALVDKPKHVVALSAFSRDVVNKVQ